MNTRKPDPLRTFTDGREWAVRRTEDGWAVIERRNSRGEWREIRCGFRGRWDATHWVRDQPEKKFC